MQNWYQLIQFHTLSPPVPGSLPTAGTVEVQNVLFKTFVWKFRLVKLTWCPHTHQSHHINNVYYWWSVNEMWKLCERDGISTGQWKCLCERRGNRLVNLVQYLNQPPPRCLHLIVVRRFENASDPESYTSGSVATGRASLAGQIKG